MPCAPCAAANCSASRPATSSASSTSRASCRRSPTSPRPPWWAPWPSPSALPRLSAARSPRECLSSPWGGSEAELGYSSDADLIFVHDPVPGADEKDASEAAFAIANDIRRLLMAPSPDPALVIDADLRPEGRQGPLVRSLESYRAYYERWSSPWEAQALIRARPVAGDTGLGAEFTAMIDSLRWPAEGISDADTREMRRLKARMESERLPRGADPAMHLKQGRGGLADVEWVAQLLQLRHAAQVPTLRTTSTLAALDAAARSDLLDPVDAQMLETSWLLATRVRGAITLTSGLPSDSVPTSGPGLVAIAHLLDYRPPADLLEAYRRTTRRARGVVERVFYE